MGEDLSYIPPRAENFRMGQPEEESDDESQSGGLSPTIPNQERTESSSAVTDADAEKARSEYLETLRQGLKVIESAFDQLTWEINIPQPYREARVMSIQAGAKDYLVAGLRQPEFAGSIIKMFANYCTEQNKLDLFPYIEEIITEEDNLPPEVLAQLTAIDFEQLFTLAEKLDTPQPDTNPAAETTPETENDTRRYLRQYLIPRAFERVAQSWRFDEAGGVAKKIAELGDAEQQKLLRQAVLDHLAADPQSLTIIDSWQSMAKDSEKMSQELGQLVEEGLTRLQLDAPAILADWRTSSGGEFMTGSVIDQKLINESLAQNFKQAVLLEQYNPGTVARLRDDKEFAIKMPCRYPIEMLIRQLEDPPGEGDSYGILILPEADENGAFMHQKEIYRKLYESMGQNQKVVIYEAADVLDVVSRINRARHTYQEAGKMSFAIIGGHGKEYSLRLGGDRPNINYNDVEYSRAELSVADLFRPGAQAVSEQFDDNADIIFVACKAGSDMGLSFELSMENPEATVTAPKIPAALQSLEAYTKSNGKVGVRGEFTQNSTSRRIDGSEQAT